MNTAPTPNELTHERDALINFRDHLTSGWHHGYRWVDHKHFRLPPTPATDRELLTALIAHEQFRDTYIGAGVIPEEPRHGPYWITAITPDQYEPLPAHTCERIIRDWSVPACTESPALESDLQREIFDPMTAADRVYHLGELGDENTHDWGRIHEYFHEFVVIDRTAGHLTLIVAADD
ncbi:hypothetical protein [Streptomyces sp. NPDC059072]|uniref:hypothetical protein n=1 Tax=unclassified Streptomyces TaxID=2593676 RepID=UPI0036C92F9B